MLCTIFNDDKMQTIEVAFEGKTALTNNKNNQNG